MPNPVRDVGAGGENAATHGAPVLWLLLIVGTWQCVAAFRPVPWIIDRFTFDDTYLALQVGLNWAEHAFPTFDGLHRTNGFQALWVVVIRLLAMFTRDHILLLRSALIVTAFLNTSTGLLLWRLGRTAFSEAAAATWIVAFWCLYCISGRPAMIGLDNALIAPLVVGALLAIHHLRNAPRFTGRWCLAAGILGLGCWARLDYAVIVAVAWAALGIWAWRERALWRWIPAGAILVAAAALLGTFNYWAGGTITPVSGAIKRMVAARMEPAWTVPVLVRAVWDTLDALLKHFALGVGGVWPPLCSALTRVGIVVVFVIALAKRYVRFDFWTTTWIAALVLHVFALRIWLGAYHRQTMWYYGPQHVSACILLGACCAAWVKRLASAKWQVRWPLIIGASKLPLAVSALFIAPTVETGALNQYASALWLRDHVSESDRVAAWNAGHVAYFSNRTVINLDGLVNDERYFELIKAEQAGESYLDEQAVIWVVDRARVEERTDRMSWRGLPAERWQEVTRIGQDPDLQQLVVRRRSPD